MILHTVKSMITMMDANIHKIDAFLRMAISYVTVATLSDDCIKQFDNNRCWEYLFLSGECGCVIIGQMLKR